MMGYDLAADIQAIGPVSTRRRPDRTGLGHEHEHTPSGRAGHGINRARYPAWRTGGRRARARPIGTPGSVGLAPLSPRRLPPYTLSLVLDGPCEEVAGTQHRDEPAQPSGGQPEFHRVLTDGLPLAAEHNDQHRREDHHKHRQGESEPFIAVIPFSRPHRDNNADQPDWRVDRAAEAEQRNRDGFEPVADHHGDQFSAEPAERGSERAAQYAQPACQPGCRARLVLLNVICRGKVELDTARWLVWSVFVIASARAVGLGGGRCALIRARLCRPSGRQRGPLRSWAGPLSGRSPRERRPRPRPAAAERAVGLRATG